MGAEKDAENAQTCRCGHPRKSHRERWSWLSKSNERTGACGKRCGCSEFRCDTPARNQS